MVSQEARRRAYAPAERWGAGAPRGRLPGPQEASVVDYEQMTRPGVLAAAVTMLAAFVAVVGAGASSSSAAAPSTGVASAAMSVGLTVVAALAVALAVLVALALARRNRGPEDAAEGRHSPWARLAALGFAFGLIALFVVALRHLLHPRRRSATTGLATSPGLHHVAHGGPATSFDPSASLATVGVLVLLAAGLLARRYLARRRTPYRGLSPLAVPEPAVPVPPEAAETGDEEASLAAPADREASDPRAEVDPRLAVVSAYLLFTSAMERSGSGRMAHETPAEFSARLGCSARLGGGAVPAVGHLTSCFNAARYGAEPVTEDDRAACLADLDEIASVLEVPA